MKLSKRSLSELIKSTPHIISRAFSTVDLTSSYSSNRPFTGNNSINKHDINPKTLVNLLEQSLKTHKYDRAYIINKIIPICAKSHLFDTGIQLHSTLIKLGFVSNVYICSALVDFYAKCGSICSAHKVFDEMPQRNVVTWNSLLNGYLNAGFTETAVGLFVEMVREGVTPSVFGVSGVLVGCSRLGVGELGVQIHGLCVKCGFVWNVVVGTGLVDMYVKCWSLKEARRAFDWTPEKNGVTWTVMVAGYAHDKLPYEAMRLFKEMKRLGYKSDCVTCNSLLSSFSCREHLDHCKQIHSQVVREGLEFDVYIQISLVSVYAECNCSLQDFDKVCLCVEKQDQVSWNAFIAGFTHLGCSEKAFECFFKMRQSGIACGVITLTSMLRAIGTVSDLDVGEQVHALAFKIGGASNVYVQNGLISMYGRCGLLGYAEKVFFTMAEHDLISWNSLLAEFSHHGYGQEVIELFEKMSRTRTQPDQNTFVSVLSACSHAGLVHKGLQYFDLAMKLFPQKSLTMDLYASVVEMYGRAGYVHEAEAFIRNMPIPPEPSIYKSLLSAGKLYGDIEVEKWASERLLGQHPCDTVTPLKFDNIIVLN